MVEQDSLNVRNVLKGTYALLRERHNPKEIVFPNGVLTEIGNDSDWHRTKVGYMGYESAGLFQLDGVTWAIARGEKCGSYPAEPYDSDLLALEVIVEGKTHEKIQEELSERIAYSSYFIKSLVCGAAAGNLFLSYIGRFGKEMSKMLKPEIQRFIAQKPEYDRSVILGATLQYPTIKIMLYKPEFVDFLADSIESVLRD